LSFLKLGWGHSFRKPIFAFFSIYAFFELTSKSIQSGINDKESGANDQIKFITCPDNDRFSNWGRIRASA